MTARVFVCVCVQRFYKKAAAFVLRAVAKHSPELSQAVVACGGVDALVLCLEEFDPGVKEAAAWALGYIARHNACEGDAQASTASLFHVLSLPFDLDLLCICFHASRLFPSRCSVVSVSGGCGRFATAGVESSGARDGTQTHRGLHPQ